MHVCGVPGKWWSTSDDGEQKTLAKIKEANKKGFLMFSTTYGYGDDICGLVSGHAY